MFASKEGTHKFKTDSITKNIHPTHFRSLFDLELTSIGLGTYLGEPTHEVDKKIERVVKACLRSGAINVIDTAINYRWQRAERSIGKALRELFSTNEFSRDQIFISTKCGYVAPGEEKYYNNVSEYVFEEIINQHICRKEDIAGGIHSMSASFLEFQLEQSLKNLQMEGIDLLYLHNAAESQFDYITPPEFYDKLHDVFTFFEKMRYVNKIKWYGLATWDSLRVIPSSQSYVSLEKVVQIAREAGGENNGFKFIQAPINFLQHQAVSLKNQYIDNKQHTLLDATQKFGIKLFASGPLSQGGTLRSLMQPNFPLLTTKAQKAIQYSRSAHNNIVTALVGMKKQEHVEENLRVATVPPATKEEIEKAF